VFNLSLLKLQEDTALRTVIFSKAEIAQKNTPYILNHTAQQLTAGERHSIPNQVCATIESMPVENENENEVETETLFDNLIHILKPTESYSTDLQSLFFYNNAYEHLIIKIHFLDIFSPPPNC